MERDAEKPRKLMLHACCGPCSMEPVRLLRERGIEPHVHFANPNIAPDDEYARRLATLREFAEREGLALTEGERDTEAWERTAGAVGTANREARCRACYRLRFEAAARAAAAGGFDALGTTLSVSPYQYTDVIREELERACAHAGLRCFFEDYSPHYAEATRRSRAAGMYRQNYCGCRFSEEEARLEREERARERAAQKKARAAARAPEEARLAERRRERAAYDAKQARKRAVLKAMREERRKQA